MVLNKGVDWNVELMWVVCYLVFFLPDPQQHPDGEQRPCPHLFNFPSTRPKLNIFNLHKYANTQGEFWLVLQSVLS